jgi:hypothetical protein
MPINVAKFTSTTSILLSNFDQCRFENLGRGLAVAKSALDVRSLILSSPSPTLFSCGEALHPTELYIQSKSVDWSL